MLYGYSTRRKTTTKVVRVFTTGSGGEFKDISVLEQEGIPSNTTYLTSFGILRGTAEVYKKAIANNINYLHIDHAYFLAGHHKHKDPWYRVSKNGINLKQLNKVFPQDRFDHYFKSSVNIKPWRVKSTGHILVLPPTQPTAWYLGADNWLNDTVNWLQTHTDRQVIVRYKPPVTFCDSFGFPLQHELIEQKKNEMKPLVRQTSFEEDIQDAYCVIAYNSGAVVKAISEGVPVFSTDQAPSWPISFDLSDINNTKRLSQEPDRQRWFNALAYHQFHLSEMENGTAWNLIQEWVL
jgi:hypothetical protein